MINDIQTVLKVADNEGMDEVQAARNVMAKGMMFTEVAKTLAAIEASRADAPKVADGAMTTAEIGYAHLSPRQPTEKAMATIAALAQYGDPIEDAISAISDVLAMRFGKPSGPIQDAAAAIDKATSAMRPGTRTGPKSSGPAPKP